MDGNKSLMFPAVHILMSTYNGEAYLHEQIASIVQQTVRSRLFVRDDGSTDGTLHLLDKLSRVQDVSWSRGDNVGSAASFFGLLHKHSERADYVAFADQDDVWLREKIERALAALAQIEKHRPALYCSSATITDEWLKPLGTTPIWPRQPAFGNALVENIACGCTIVLNKPAIDLLTYVPPPRRILVHDWWCYLVVSAFGEIIYDSKPSLLYRQHRKNLVGATSSTTKQLVRKLARQFKQDSLAIILTQAEEFELRYGRRLSSGKAAVLNTLLGARESLLPRQRLLFDQRIYRQSKQDDVLLRLRFASGPWPAPAPDAHASTRKHSTLSIKKRLTAQ